MKPNILHPETSEPTTHRTLGELIEIIISYETAAYDLYLGLASKFSMHRSIADFWQTMATHEEGHIRLLRKMYEDFSVETLGCVGDPRIAEKVQNLPKIDVEECLMAVDDLDQAYQLAHKIESSAVSVRLSFLTQKLFDDKDYKHSIAKSINQHLQSLMGLPETIGDAKTRKSIHIDSGSGQDTIQK